MEMDEMTVLLTDLEARAKSNTHRLDKLEQRQDHLDKLVSAVTGLQKDLEYTQVDVREIKRDVKAMMDGPRKNWSAILTAAITALTAALVTAVVSLILR